MHMHTAGTTIEDRILITTASHRQEYHKTSLSITFLLDQHIFTFQGLKILSRKGMTLTESICIILRYQAITNNNYE